MLTNPPTLSVAEAAAATGFSRQAIHRAVKDGRLSRFLIRDAAGHCRLLPEAVGQIRSGLLRQRIDTARPAPPPPPPPPPPAPEPEPGDEDGVRGSAWGPWANELLDLPQWGPPPWPAYLWVTLSIVIDEAVECVGKYGLLTPESLAQFRADTAEEEAEFENG
jgi:hypothetical protein